MTTRVPSSTDSLLIVPDDAAHVVQGTMVVDLGVIAAAGVTSVFARTGAVVAASGDYKASEVINDSGVGGVTVAGALDSLLATRAPIASPTFTGAPAAPAPPPADASTRIATTGWVAGEIATAALWSSDGMAVSNTEPGLETLILANDQTINIRADDTGTSGVAQGQVRVTPGVDQRVEFSCLGAGGTNASSVTIVGDDSAAPDDQGSVLIQAGAGAAPAGRIQMSSQTGLFTHTGRNGATYDEILDEVPITIPSAVLTDVVEVPINLNELVRITMDVDLSSSTYAVGPMIGNWHFVVVARRQGGPVSVLGTETVIVTPGGFAAPQYSLIPTATSVKFQIAVTGNCVGVAQVNYTAVRKAI